MSYTHELYNNLPSLHDAYQRLKDLKGGYEPLLQSLGPVFRSHTHLGICLVHAHCLLSEGEKMVSSGRISQPETGVKCYPERWLADGTPYEFSSTPTIEGDSLPSEVVKEFQSKLKSYGDSLGGEDLTGLLGIYFVHDPDQPTEIREDIVWMEKTEGRKNIVEPVPRAEAGEVPNMTPAAWIITIQEDEDGIWGRIQILGSCSCQLSPTHLYKYGQTEIAPSPFCTHGCVLTHHCKHHGGK